MALVDDVAEDLGGIRQAQPMAYVDSLKGPTYGKVWADQGPTIDVVRRKTSASERFRMGMSVTTQSYTLYTRLPDGVPPLTERQRVRVDGKTLDVQSVVPVEAPGDEGAVCIGVVV